MCVRNVDDQGVLQFTLIHAVGCVLHRRGSRAIHRLQLFLFQSLACLEGERKDASIPLSRRAEWEKKGKKKWGEESRRSRTRLPRALDSLERADRCLHRPTRTRTSSRLTKGAGLPLATWIRGRPRVQGAEALLQSADRPDGSPDPRGSRVRRKLRDAGRGDARPKRENGHSGDDDSLLA